MKTKQFVIRWSLLVGGLIAAFWSIWFYKVGSVPTVTSIALPLIGNSSIVLPFGVSRWWDILFGMIVSIVIATFVAISYNLYHRDEGYVVACSTYLKIDHLAGVFPISLILASFFLWAFDLSGGLVASLIIGLVASLIIGLVFNSKKIENNSLPHLECMGIEWGGQYKISKMEILFYQFIQVCFAGLGLGIAFGLYVGLGLGIILGLVASLIFCSGISLGIALGRLSKLLAEPIASGLLKANHFMTCKE